MTSNLLELQEIQKSVLSSENISGVICLKNETQPQVGVKTFTLSKSAMVLYFCEAFLLTETTQQQRISDSTKKKKSNK